MRADLRFVTAKFNEFNAFVFGGELPLPDIVVVTARTFAGKFTYRVKRDLFGRRHACDPCLRISRCFDLPQAEIEDTILHEMIHYYVMHKRISDTSPHGEHFMRIMREINKRHGRHIRVSSRVDRVTGATDTRVRSHLVCLITVQDGTNLVMVCSHTCFADVYSGMKRWPVVASMRWFMSRDSFFNRYPRSRRPCGYKISPDDIREHVLTAKELDITAGKDGKPIKITAAVH